MIMIPVAFIIFIVILSGSSSLALVIPYKNIRVGGSSCYPQRYQSTTYTQDPRRGLLLPPLYTKWEVEEEDDGTDDDDFLQQATTTQQSISDRIQTGNTLELLALAVSVFFLVTVGLTRNTLFNSELASQYNYSTNQDGKIRAVYKYIDANAVLQEDFDRYDSKVTFDD